jgi:methionine-rich copper-binding protein CopC
MATSVFAHTHLKSETPAAGSTVSAPKDLRLVFSEGVEAKFTKVSITADGAVVAVKSIETAPGDQKTLIVTPEKPLTAGKYKVEWHAVSVDTHKSDGDYGFTVGD